MCGFSIWEVEKKKEKPLDILKKCTYLVDVIPLYIQSVVRSTLCHMPQGCKLLVRAFLFQNKNLIKNFMHGRHCPYPFQKIARITSSATKPENNPSGVTFLSFIFWEDRNLPEYDVKKID